MIAVNDAFHLVIKSKLTRKSIAENDSTYPCARMRRCNIFSINSSRSLRPERGDDRANQNDEFNKTHYTYDLV